MKTFRLLDTFAQDGFYLTQGYGVNASYYSQFNLLYHEGVDFGHFNKKILFRSPISGVVILDDDDGRGNYGNNIKIWDDEQLCAIQVCHLDFNLVEHGQRVEAGDPLGEMGSTGNSTGEHIHFNFMQTDKNGVRLYRSKSCNWGYLDPQHPNDPNPPKYPPGVQSYNVVWYTKSEDNMSELTECVIDRNHWWDNQSRLIRRLLGNVDITEENVDNLVEKSLNIVDNLEEDKDSWKTKAEEREKKYISFLERVSKAMGSLVAADEENIIVNLQSLVKVEDKLLDAQKALDKKEAEYAQKEKEWQAELDDLKATISKLNLRIENLEEQIDQSKDEKAQNDWLGKIIQSIIDSLKGSK